MTHHDHKHEHHGDKHQHRSKGKSKGIHKDWRTWTVIVLMLGAILIYVFSDNESLQPGGEAGEGMPAADSPPVEAAP